MGLAALLLAACGTGNDGGPAPETSAAATASTAAAPDYGVYDVGGTPALGSGSSGDATPGPPEYPSQIGNRATTVLGGTVVEIEGPHAFLVQTPFSDEPARMEYDPAAQPEYPPGHVIAVGDEVHARGAWQGEMDASTFVATAIEVNINRIRAGLTPLGDGWYEAYAPRRDETWQVLIAPANLTAWSINAERDIPRSAMLNLPEGTGADIIGYLTAPRVMVVTWIDASLPAQRETAPSQAPTIATLPGTEHRDHLVVCVDLAPGLDLDPVAAASLVAESLEPIHLELIGVDDSRDTEVRAGCPDGFVQPPPTNSPKQVVGRGNVSEPLDERLLVFVTNDDRTFSRAAYEMLCEGHQCWEVTTAVYIGAEAFLDPQSRAFAIKQGLGLILPAPSNDPYPEGHPVSTPSVD